MALSGRERGRRLRNEIYAAYEAAQQTRRPNRVRPSSIGHECTRAGWYALRWADDLETFSGQMLRLFETGHSQEERLLADLRRIDAQIISRDPNNGAEQISIEAMGGHVKGYLDGVAQRLPHTDQEWCVTECKSHNSKSFRALERDGVEVAKPEHYAQMQLYLHEQGLKEALYLAVNKDTDELYAEFVPYNAFYAERLMRKAEQIVFSGQAPERIHKSPDFYVCKFCNARNICHFGKLPVRTCRTCIECRPASPAEGAPDGQKWDCMLHNKFLTIDEQRAGCPDHRYNPNLIKGRQETVTDDAITYILENTGEVYVDRGPAHDIHTPEPAISAGSTD